MNLKKIIVYEYDSLFHILDELKEKFNFDLIKVNKKSLKEFQKLTKDYLILTKTKNKEFSNQLAINKIPIKIDRLIQLININLLQKNFNSQSDVTVGSYKLNINSRTISKNDDSIDLTEREINLILFLQKSKSGVKIDELQKEVWEYGSQLETHTVETHIYRLRKKIKNKFNDENFIVSSKEGYIIN